MKSTGLGIQKFPMFPNLLLPLILLTPVQLLLRSQRLVLVFTLRELTLCSSPGLEGGKTGSTGVLPGTEKERNSSLIGMSK